MRDAGFFEGIINVGVFICDVERIKGSEAGERVLCGHYCELRRILLFSL